MDADQKQKVVALISSRIKLLKSLPKALTPEYETQLRKDVFSFLKRLGRINEIEEISIRPHTLANHEFLNALIEYLQQLIVDFNTLEDEELEAKGDVPDKDLLSELELELEEHQKEMDLIRQNTEEWVDKWIKHHQEQEERLKKLAQGVIEKTPDMPEAIKGNAVGYAPLVLTGAKKLSQTPQSEQSVVKTQLSRMAQTELRQRYLAVGLSPRAEEETILLQAMELLAKTAQEDLRVTPAAEGLEPTEKEARFWAEQKAVEAVKVQQVAANEFEAAYRAATPSRRAEIDGVVHRVEFERSVDDIVLTTTNPDDRRRLEAFVLAVQRDPVSAAKLRLFSIKDRRSIEDVARVYEQQAPPSLATFVVPPSIQPPPPAEVTAASVRQTISQPSVPGHTSQTLESLVMGAVLYQANTDALFTKYGYTAGKAEGVYVQLAASDPNFKDHFERLIKQTGSREKALKEIYFNQMSGNLKNQLTTELAQLKTNFHVDLIEQNVILSRELVDKILEEPPSRTIQPTQAERHAHFDFSHPRAAHIPELSKEGVQPRRLPPELSRLFSRLRGGFRSLANRHPFLLRISKALSRLYESLHLPGFFSFLRSFSHPFGSALFSGLTAGLERLVGAAPGGLNQALQGLRSMRAARMGAFGLKDMLLKKLALSSTAWLLLALSGVIIMFATGFTSGVTPRPNRTIRTVQIAHLPPTSGDFRAAIPTDIASGTCPVNEPHSILVGTFSAPNGRGHGTDWYWSQVYDCPGETTHCFSIPDSGMYVGGCKDDKTCPYYGLAIDVVANSGNLAEVAVPYLCANGDVCDAPFMNWTVDYTFESSSGTGTGVFLDSYDNGHHWRIYLQHINYNGSTTLTTEPGNNIVGTLHPNATPPHLHFEITMDTIPIDPTPFCDGSAAPAPGGACQAPRSGRCSPDDSITQLKAHFGEEADNAARICFAESAGVSDEINLNCSTQDYSIGLFQINLLGNDNIMPPGLRAAIDGAGYPGEKCYAALASPTSETQCGSIKPGYERLLQTCINWLIQPQNNVLYARMYYEYKVARDPASGWDPWSTSLKCRIRSGSPPPLQPQEQTALVLQGSVSDLVVSNLSEINSRPKTCDWAAAKSLAGATNANYYKGDFTPVGWAGFGAGTVKDYGPGDAPPTKVFKIDVNGNASIVDYDISTVGQTDPNLKLAVSGVRVLPSDGKITNRTGLGLLPNNEAALVVIPNATNEDQAAVFRSLGVTSDANMMELDGGGKSTFCAGSATVWGGTVNPPVNIGFTAGTTGSVPVP